MDRTQEYKFIFQSLNVYQQKPPNFLSIDRFKKITDDLKQLKHELSQKSFSQLEKEKIQEKFSNIENTLNSIKPTLNNQDLFDSLQEENVKTLIKELEATKKRSCNILFQKCLDMYTNLLKKEEARNYQQKEYFYSDNNQHSNSVFLEQQEQVLAEETHFRQRSDIQQKRDRIQAQINELGQIVCDISLHIQAQGENIKRIDDMVDDSGNFLKQNLYELRRIEKMIKGQRKTIVTFFAFFFAVLLIYWFFKRS